MWGRDKMKNLHRNNTYFWRQNMINPNHPPILQNSADEPGGDKEMVDSAANSNSPPTTTAASSCQPVKQGEDEVEVSKPSSSDILTAAEQVDSAAAVEGEVEGGGVSNRLTKSASWFNSLSRRASRKTPLKKRSFPGYRSVEKPESLERGEVGWRDTSRLRLNK